MSMYIAIKIVKKKPHKEGKRHGGGKGTKAAVYFCIKMRDKRVRMLAFLGKSVYNNTQL